MKKLIYKVTGIILSVMFLAGITPVVFASVYSDVPANSWYNEAVNYVTENGLMSGTGNSTFSPDENMSRGMLMTVLYRAEGSPAIKTSIRFSDVASDAYYADAVSWAVQNNIVLGVGDNKFSSDTPVTREQFATILYRYAQSKGYNTSLKKELMDFADAGEAGSYAVNAICWAVANKIIQGSDGKLNPGGDATRSETAAILKRFLENAKIFERPAASEQYSNIVHTMNVTVGSTTFTATLEDNDTAKALVAQLPLKMDMSELNGNEKYSFLSGNLSVDMSSCPDTINEGDIMLYSNNCIVIFYKSFNTSYSYVKLGHINNTTGLANALGPGYVQVGFSIRN